MTGEPEGRDAPPPNVRLGEIFDAWEDDRQLEFCGEMMRAPSSGEWVANKLLAAANYPDAQEALRILRGSAPAGSAPSEPSDEAVALIADELAIENVAERMEIARVVLRMAYKLDGVTRAAFSPSSGDAPSTTPVSPEPGAQP